MPRIWLRLELFEHGLLQFPSKYSSTLTVANVKASLDALHARFQQTATIDADAMGAQDVNMDDAAASTYIETDNINSVTFPFWKETVAPIFQWRDQDYKAFWLLLVYFHRKIPVKESFMIPATTVLDEEQCLVREAVPMFKLVIFLFIQTVKPHSWRVKYSVESFNAVWYREDFAMAGHHSPGNGNISPQFKGNTSPPPPPSPHTVGMHDRSTSDAYYLEFIREKLEDLFGLLYPSAALAEESATTVSADQIDLLGFLLCAGGRNMVDLSQNLSSAYPKWQTSPGDSPFSEHYQGKHENAGKICAFFKKHLYLNDTLYPPVGFSLASVAQGGSYSPIVSGHSGPGRDFSLSDEAAQDRVDDESHILQRPTVISSLSKTTVIKRAEDFVDKFGNSDLVIFSCHDAFIYILGPVRHVMITACSNCKIVTAPSSGIYCIDRCENVQVSAIAGLIRVSNSLDSVINTYTLVPMIMTGENVGVRLGPYNSKYPGLHQQFQTAQLAYRPESVGCWDSFLNLEDESEYTESEKEPIALQSPATFREICVPVKINGAGPAERPFPLPSGYAEALHAQHETVENLRKLVCSDEFDLTTKRTMETVIQMKFKEWLSATGNARQILDLVQIERARGGSTTSSPVKDRA